MTYSKGDEVGIAITMMKVELDSGLIVPTLVLTSVVLLVRPDAPVVPIEIHPHPSRLVPPPSLAQVHCTLASGYLDQISSSPLESPSSLNP
jgi:hypothetical protein